MHTHVPNHLAWLLIRSCLSKSLCWNGGTGTCARILFVQMITGIETPEMYKSLNYTFFFNLFRQHPVSTDVVTVLSCMPVKVAQNLRISFRLMLSCASAVIVSSFLHFYFLRHFVIAKICKYLKISKIIPKLIRFIIERPVCFVSPSITNEI